MNLHRLSALGLFIAIAVVDVNPALLRFPWLDLPQQHRLWTSLPESDWRPDYAQFLEDVRAHTGRGDTILIVLRPRFYMFGYFRAGYALAGREVLPFLTPSNAVIRENVARAKYVAAWQPGEDRFAGRVVFVGHHGVLVER